MRFNRLATVRDLEKEKSQTSCKKVSEVGDQSPTFFKIESVTSYILKMPKRRAVAEFGGNEVSVVTKQLPTSRRLIN